MFSILISFLDPFNITSYKKMFILWLRKDIVIENECELNAQVFSVLKISMLKFKYEFWDKQRVKIFYLGTDVKFSEDMLIDKYSTKSHCN